LRPSCTHVNTLSASGAEPTGHAFTGIFKNPGKRGVFEGVAIGIPFLGPIGGLPISGIPMRGLFSAEIIPVKACPGVRLQLHANITEAVGCKRNVRRRVTIWRTCARAAGSLSAATAATAMCRQSARSHISRTTGLSIIECKAKEKVHATGNSKVLIIDREAGDKRIPRWGCKALLAIKAVASHAGNGSTIELAVHRAC